MDINQSFMEDMRKLIREIKRTNDSKDVDEKVERVSRGRKSGTFTTEHVINDFKKLRREVDYNVDSLRKSSKGWREIMKDMITPANSLRKIFDDSAKKFKEHVRHNSDEFRQISQGTLKTFHDIIKKGGNFTNEMEKLAKMQDGFQDIFKNFKGNIKGITEEANIKKEIEELNKQRSSIQAEITKAKKIKRHTAAKLKN